MKMIIDRGYNGYHIPDEVLHWELPPDAENEHRTDPRFIEWVKTHKNNTGLAVVEIPDNATDWELEDYDGRESIIAVVDGKIIHIG
jgi:beta-glucanase (GH16 family)